MKLNPNGRFLILELIICFWKFGSRVCLLPPTPQKKMKHVIRFVVVCYIA